ncbi:hypothetical protein HK405_006401 [Cladochytrium tenue]|nr:hypothetical protein HK405_006401 [Cladochytrium tenue]
MSCVFLTLSGTTDTITLQGDGSRYGQSNNFHRSLRIDLPRSLKDLPHDAIRAAFAPSDTQFIKDIRGSLTLRKDPFVYVNLKSDYVPPNFEAKYRGKPLGVMYKNQRHDLYVFDERTMGVKMEIADSLFAAKDQELRLALLNVYPNACDSAVRRSSSADSSYIHVFVNFRSPADAEAARAMGELTISVPSLSGSHRVRALPRLQPTSWGDGFRGRDRSGRYRGDYRAPTRSSERATDTKSPPPASAATSYVSVASKGRPSGYARSTASVVSVSTSVSNQQLTVEPDQVSTQLSENGDGSAFDAPSETIISAVEPSDMGETENISEAVVEETRETNQDDAMEGSVTAAEPEVSDDDVVTHTVSTSTTPDCQVKPDETGPVVETKEPSPPAESSEEDSRPPLLHMESHPMPDGNPRLDDGENNTLHSPSPLEERESPPGDEEHVVLPKASLRVGAAEFVPSDKPVVPPVQYNSGAVYVRNDHYGPEVATTTFALRLPSDVADAMSISDFFDMYPSAMSVLLTSRVANTSHGDTGLVADEFIVKLTFSDPVEAMKSCSGGFLIRGQYHQAFPSDEKETLPLDTNVLRVDLPSNFDASLICTDVLDVLEPLGSPVAAVSIRGFRERDRLSRVGLKGPQRSPRLFVRVSFASVAAAEAVRGCRVTLRGFEVSFNSALSNKLLFDVPPDLCRTTGQSLARLVPKLFPLDAVVSVDVHSTDMVASAAEADHLKNAGHHPGSKGLADHAVHSSEAAAAACPTAVAIITFGTEQLASEWRGRTIRIGRASAVLRPIN